MMQRVETLFYAQDVSPHMWAEFRTPVADAMRDTAATAMASEAERAGLRLDRGSVKQSEVRGLLNTGRWVPEALFPAESEVAPPPVPHRRSWLETLICGPAPIPEPRRVYVLHYRVPYTAKAYEPVRLDPIVATGQPDEGLM